MNMSANAGKNKGIYTFPKDISSKVNVMWGVTGVHCPALLPLRYANFPLKLSKWF